MHQSLRINAQGIAIFAGLTAAVIALTFVLTKPTIEHNIKVQKSAKLYQIVSADSTDRDLLDTSFTLNGTPLGYEGEITAYKAINNGTVSAVIFPVLTGKGYSGDIALLVGVNADESLAGVRVITHRETPGLGDKLELKKSPWIRDFDLRKKEENTPWAVKKDGGDFDQFTGATITPRAVVNAVGDTLDFFRANKAQLLTLPANNEATQ